MARDYSRFLRRSLGIAGETIVCLKISDHIKKKKAEIRSLNDNHRQFQSNTAANFGDFDLEVIWGSHRTALLDIKTRTENYWEYNSNGEYVFKYPTVIFDAVKWKELCEVKGDAFIIWVSPNGSGLFYMHKPKNNVKSWIERIKLEKGTQKRKRSTKEVVYFNVGEKPISCGWNNLQEEIDKLIDAKIYR